jgi:hypothetical protein
MESSSKIRSSVRLGYHSPQLVEPSSWSFPGEGMREWTTHLPSDSRKKIRSTPKKQFDYLNVTPEDVIRPWRTDSISFEIDKFLSDVSKYVKIINVFDVRNFLNSESFKLSSYETIITKIIKLKRVEFGDSAQLSLQINRDPEIDNEFLKFYIRQNEYSTDFMDKIDRLQEKYFEDLHKYDIWLLVSTDFKSPITSK